MCGEEVNGEDGWLRRWRDGIAGKGSADGGVEIWGGEIDGRVGIWRGGTDGDLGRQAGWVGVDEGMGSEDRWTREDLGR